MVDLYYKDENFIFDDAVYDAIISYSDATMVLKAMAKRLP